MLFSKFFLGGSPLCGDRRFDCTELPLEKSKRVEYRVYSSFPEGLLFILFRCRFTKRSVVLLKLEVPCHGAALCLVHWSSSNRHSLPFVGHDICTISLSQSFSRCSQARVAWSPQPSSGFSEYFRPSFLLFGSLESGSASPRWLSSLA